MSVTRIDLDEQELANRYLAGRLTDAECEAFENRLVQEPELIRDLEAVARFKVGLQVLEERGELENAIRGSRWTPAWFAVAAAAALVVVGVLLVPYMITVRQPSLLASIPASLTDRQGNVLPSAGSFTLLRKRVTTADAVIDLPPPGRAIEVRVLPESPPPQDGYTVSVWRQPQNGSAEKLGSTPHVTAAADGFLTVFIDTTRLTQGEYLLVISAPGGDDRPAGGDVFRIQLNPAHD